MNLEITLAKRGLVKKSYVCLTNIKTNNYEYRNAKISFERNLR